MLRFIIPFIVILVGCGAQPPAPPSEPARNAATQASTAATHDTAVVGVLAIALEGDVELTSETEYRSIGPEIRCSAMLMDAGEPQPVATEVEWKAEPAGSGVFSSGAHGVFFLSEGSGRVEIHAILKTPDGRALRSPKVFLIVP